MIKGCCLLLFKVTILHNDWLKILFKMRLRTYDMYQITEYIFETDTSNTTANSYHI